MKKIFIILALSTLACTPENSEDSIETYTSQNSESAYASKGSRPQNWAEKITGTPFNNLYKINDDIYRSEQPGSNGFNYFQQNHIVSILNLREFHKDNIGGTSYTGSLYRVPMNGVIGLNSEIINALRTIKTAPKPIDIHCQYGSDRTGYTVAMYRIVFQNWSKDEAIKEMTQGGYNFHWLTSGELVTYVRNVNIDYIKTQVFN
ncbi:Tyrosine phosphatase family protein [Chryseobacterium rhizoplanae]|uniref:Tyrosine phosphatase family protein n=1 Tax=Chryseobacterium rhizoplanae TaxID=1609531 RepID=A0A521DWC5_9FLAO|nr:dual specificity protein phosphatase family protein [Chryseobacterium rhizoplanae]SMO75180.1 Tyrosine phosphatase family protein [Chryseobacterium rhizoplanae]